MQRQNSRLEKWQIKETSGCHFKTKKNVFALKYLHMDIVEHKEHYDGKICTKDRINNITQNVNMWCTAQSSVDGNEML